MVKRPIHIRLIKDSVNQEKLLEDFQKMQITFMESVLAENDLSGEEKGQIIYAVREILRF